MAIARALEANGFAAQDIFAEAGLDLSQANDPELRYPVKNMSEVWRLAVARTENPCFGLVVPQYVHPTALNALGFALMASESLKEAVERIVRFSRTVTDAADVRLVEETDGYKFLVEDIEDQLNPSYE